ncbi:MAG: pilus (MSHA type) biogenesis protein MshL [Campylobacter sp.]
MLKLDKFIILMLLFFAPLCEIFASQNCNDRAFNIKINEQASISEILNQLSEICEFSVVSKDKFVKNILTEEISGINIKNMTLKEIFDLLLLENNVNYDFSKNMLKIQALQTKTFKIDYITSIREGTAITKASVDSAPIQVGNEQEDKEIEEVGRGGGKLDNLIKTTEKFDFWENLDKEIKAILNNTTENITAPDPIINQNAGLITVTGTPSQLKRVGDYIKNLQNRLKKQVIIDVSIISVELANSYTKGVDWSKFSIGFKTGLFDAFIPSARTDDGTKTPTFSYSPTPGNSISWSNRTNGLGGGFKQNINLISGFNFNLDGVINFLETNGKTKIISSPKIVTLNNQQALISVGDNINYRVREESTKDNSANTRTTFSYKQYSVFIGILLNLLPEVSEDNKIMLRINPSLSSFKYQEDDIRQATTIREIAPDTIQKKLSTVVHVNSGDTIVLGGLIGQTKGKDDTKIPLLGDIPVIGYAFKNQKDTLRTNELVFIITPRVIDISLPINQTLKDLGFSKAIYE